MSKSNDKLRKVYKRNSIVHVCFDGAFYAPSDSEATEVAVGAGVKATPVGEVGEDELPVELEVFQPVPKRKGVRETWTLTEVPRGAKRAKKAA